MTSGAATMLGPDAVVIALAPAGPARAALGELLTPRRGLGRAHHRGGARATGRRVRAPARCPPTRPRTTRRCRPSRRSPCSRSRSPVRAAPIPTAPTGSSGTTARGSGTSSVPATEVQRMTRIVLVGAGSVEFTRNLLGDILSLRGAARRRDRPPRHRPRPAADRRADGRLDGRRAGRDARRSAAASTGATALTGRGRRDQHHPGRRRAGDPGRLRHPGPLRAAVHDQRHDQRGRRAPRPAHDPGRPRHRRRHGRRLPGRPGSSTTPTRWACSCAASHEAVGFPTVGLCHSVYWTVDRAGRLPRRCRAAEVDALSGRRQPPRLAAAARASGPRPVPGPARVRRRRPGARRRPRPGRPVPALRLSTPRSPRSTTPSTTRGSSPRARSSAFHVPIGEYLTRVANNLDEYADTKRRLDAGEPFEIERSGEYAARDRQLRWRPASRPGSWPTCHERRRRRSSPTSPRTPASRSRPSWTGSGVHPTAVGALPPQCAAYTRPAVDCQELTVTAALDEDRDPVYHAVLTDPHRPGPAHAR